MALMRNTFEWQRVRVHAGLVFFVGAGLLLTALFGSPWFETELTNGLLVLGFLLLIPGIVVEIISTS